MRSQIRRLRSEGVRLGDVIGEGGSKACFELPDHPGYVGLGFMEAENPGLRGEQWMLGRLRNLGVPTLRAYGVVPVREEDSRPADRDPTLDTILPVEVLVCDRWDHHVVAGGLSWNFSDFLKEIGPWLGLRHIRNLEVLRDRLYRRRVDLFDPQFLFRDTGEVCVCDPSRVRFGRQGQTRRTLNAFITDLRRIYKRHKSRAKSRG